MPAAIPAEIRPMLDAYLEAIHAQWPDLLSGFFLHGSIALGAFQADMSDIDFVAVVKRPLSEAEIACLKQIHQELIINYDKWQMEGSYLLAEDLGQENRPPRPNIHKGNLGLGQFDNNEVTWWLLKHKGVAVYGDLPDFEVDWDKLIRKMHENMNSYWRRFTNEPSYIFHLLITGAIAWTVLGTLRQYYSFCENEIISKVGAGEYGLVTFPVWQRIIQEALNIRNGKETSLYISRFHRAFDAWRFLRFIIRLSNDK